MKNRVTKITFVTLVVAFASFSSAALLVDYSAKPPKADSQAAAAISDLHEAEETSKRKSKLSGLGIAATMTLGLLGLMAKPE